MEDHAVQAISEDLAEPFRRFPELRTTDSEEYESWIKSEFRFKFRRVPHGDVEFDSVVNRIELPSISLTHGINSGQVEFDLRLNGFVQEFPLSGAGVYRWNRQSVDIRPGSASIVGGPGSESVIRLGSDYSHVFQSISAGPLTQKLAAMIGDPVDPPLELTGRPCADTSAVARQLRLIRFVGDELGRSEGLMSPMVMAELEQAIIVAFLVANEHNYSGLLKGTPRSAAPWQVKRAIDYIEANWDRVIAIENLVDATGTSARSLFYLFRKTYGLSPIVYAGRVRLRRAHAMLSRPDLQTTVASVAYACGFSNLGHFAKKYSNAFGELPSETLKKFR